MRKSITWRRGLGLLDALVLWSLVPRIMVPSLRLRGMAVVPTRKELFCPLSRYSLIFTKTTYPFGIIEPASIAFISLKF